MEIYIILYHFTNSKNENKVTQINRKHTYSQCKQVKLCLYKILHFPTQILNSQFDWSKAEVAPNECHVTFSGLA